MRNLKTFLNEWLKDAGKLAVLGIGSDLRSDDIAGISASESLLKLRSRKKKGRLRVFFGSSAPENLTGEIKKFAPTHLIMIDSVELRESPGTIILLRPQDIGKDVSFSTHKMPARALIDYFAHYIKSDIILIGIQPKNIEFGKKPSSLVINSAKEVAKIIDKAFKG